jgi:hypothetical protein
VAQLVLLGKFGFGGDLGGHMGTDVAHAQRSTVLA